MSDWERHAATTESEIVFRIKGLLKIVFEDLSDIGIVELKRYLQQFISYQQTNYLLIFFVTISGETTARATKQSKKFNTFDFAGGYNSKFFKEFSTFTPQSSSSSSPTSTTPIQASSSSTSPAATTPTLLPSPPASSASTSTSSTPSNMMGNRTDLGIYGDRSVELSLSEVKPATAKTKLQTQASKCLRDNQSIYYNLTELEVTLQFIMGTTWGGMKGELFYIKYYDGVGVEKLYANLILPYNMQLLSEFKVTLLGLYGYKVIFILANISLFLFAILLTQVS
jgi:hypothetical protein